MKRVVVLLALASPAVADDEPRVWLLDLSASTEIALYENADAGDPISVAPDISLLAADVPQIEVVHSSQGITGFHGMLLGTSFCVHGDACGDLYRDVGIQVTQMLRSHADPSGEINQAALAITGGLVAYAFDPFALAAKLAVRGSYVTTGLMQFQIVPSIHVAANERDTQPDRVFVPVTATVIGSEAVTFQLESGIASTVDGFADHLVVPLGASLEITNGGMSLLANFTFPAMYGGHAVGITGTDARVLTLALRWSTFLGGETD